MTNLPRSAWDRICWKCLWETASCGRSLWVPTRVHAVSIWGVLRWKKAKRERETVAGAVPWREWGVAPARELDYNH